MVDSPDGDTKEETPEQKNPQPQAPITPLEISQGADAHQPDEEQHAVAARIKPFFLLRNWHRWRNLKLSDQLMVLFTFVIALWAGLQWGEMHGAGQQTSDLIRAANQQVQAARDFAESASQIKAKIGETEHDFQNMANSAESSIKATQDAVRLDQRAWIGPKNMIIQPVEAGKPVVATVTIANTGKSPSLDTTVIAGLLQSLVPLHKFAPPKGIPVTPTVYFPNEEYSVKLISPIAATQADLDSVQTGKLHLYVYGVIRYVDVFRIQHVTVFCGIYDSTRGVNACEDNNSAN